MQGKKKLVCLYLFSLNTKNLCLTRFYRPGEQWTATEKKKIIMKKTLIHQENSEQQPAHFGLFRDTELQNQQGDAKTMPMVSIRGEVQFCESPKFSRFHNSRNANWWGWRRLGCWRRRTRPSLPWEGSRRRSLGSMLGTGDWPRFISKRWWFFLWYPDLQLQWRINRNHSQIQTAGATDVDQNQETVL